MNLLTRLFNRNQQQDVLFYRDFRRYSGGHQKVADYFEHCVATPRLNASISFSPESVWDSTNPWCDYRDHVRSFLPDACDILFLAGLDWQVYLDSGLRDNLPVINLIQGVRHADPASDVYPFLSQRAVRICVSEEVSQAIRSTGRVNGPVVVIPNGHAIDVEPQARERDIFVLGYKQPNLAKQLETQLSDLEICVPVDFRPRDEILQLMATSRVTVVLPFEQEGFCLPALEAMHLSDMTVVPDCVGNRSFCLPDRNCLMPGFDLASIEAATREALDVSREPARVNEFKRAAGKQVAWHSLERERAAFGKLVDQLPDLWKQV